MTVLSPAITTRRWTEHLLLVRLNADDSSIIQSAIRDLPNGREGRVFENDVMPAHSSVPLNFVGQTLRIVWHSPPTSWSPRLQSIAQLLIQQLQLPGAELRLKSRLDEAPKTVVLPLHQQGLTRDAMRVIRSSCNNSVGEEKPHPEALVRRTSGDNGQSSQR